jgi:predicted ATPase
MKCVKHVRLTAFERRFAREIAKSDFLDQSLSKELRTVSVPNCRCVQISITAFAQRFLAL